MDVSDYLRHLQILFLTACMTIGYPGFYVTAVSKLAWSCLLFWRGPIGGGHLHKGIDGGMYVSNASMGMQFMPQVLEHAHAVDRLSDSLIDLAIIAMPMFLVLSALLAVGKMPLRSVTVTAGGMTTGIALWLFSVYSGRLYGVRADSVRILAQVSLSRCA